MPAMFFYRLRMTFFLENDAGLRGLLRRADALLAMTGAWRRGGLLRR